MPAPASATYSVDAVEAANTALLALIDAGSSNGYIDLLDEGDAVLATIDFDDPAGTVSGTTGELTLSIAGPDASAANGGVASYGIIYDSDDTAIVSIPTTEGTTAVPGYITMPTTTIVAGSEVEILSGVFG